MGGVRLVPKASGPGQLQIVDDVPHQLLCFPIAVAATGINEVDPSGQRRPQGCFAALGIPGHSKAYTRERHAERALMTG